MSDGQLPHCILCGTEFTSDSDIMVPVGHKKFCAACVKAMAEYVEDKEREKSEDPLTEISSVCLTKDPDYLVYPKQIKHYLDKYVIKQTKAKEVLSVAAFSHMQRIRAASVNLTIPKSNVLLIGPTGSGKTLLAETLSKKLNVPCIIVDITKYTEAGYVGMDIEQILTLLYIEAYKDVHLAQRGIVVLDEFDKLRDLNSGTRNVSSSGVQRGLLKMVEGADIQFPTSLSKSLAPLETMNTSNILFIASGAFSDIHKQISESKQEPSVGFMGTPKQKPSRAPVITAQDVIDYGFMPEIVGRFNLITELEELHLDDMVSIMKDTDNSIIDQYKTLFSMSRVKLEFSDLFIKQVAKDAIDKKLGARGLKGILENYLTRYIINIDTYENKELFINEVSNENPSA